MSDIERRQVLLPHKLNEQIERERKARFWSFAAFMRKAARLLVMALHSDSKDVMELLGRVDREEG